MSEIRSDAPRSSSDMVLALREKGDGESVSLGEIAEETKGRANGLVLLALALPEMIPMVGLSALIAFPIFLIGGYMTWKGTESSVPGWIHRRTIKRSHLEKAIDKALPLLRWLDRLSRPRWHALAHAHRLQGVVCLLMAIVLTVPIPGVNLLAAFGVGGMGIGMLQRDGVVIAGAMASSALALGGTVAVLTGAAALFL